MGDKSLSNPFNYTICLTADEYKKHQRLIYIGSVMSQLLRENYFPGDDCKPLSYIDVLHEIEHFLKCGHQYAKLWDELALALYKVEGY